MEMIRLGGGARLNTDVRNKNFSNFREALLTEVIPRVESVYRVAKDRNSRAIAGLSMGGSESLLTALKISINSPGSAHSAPAGFPMSLRRIFQVWMRRRMRRFDCFGLHAVLKIS
jgi:S-formylglutathione hydrolase FrmB